MPQFETISPEMKQSAMLASEDAHLRALRTACRQDIQAVLFHKARGMCRRRLLEIYGDDIVNQALANGR